MCDRRDRRTRGVRGVGGPGCGCRRRSVRGPAGAAGALGPRVGAAGRLPVAERLAVALAVALAERFGVRRAVGDPLVRAGRVLCGRTRGGGRGPG
ncbi:hypothetical protein [Streptomyces sp. NBC_00557]|uniref:hypothetical protein n=1 Tax=Streptomyces sp. NBC_00557 TaxID=2975776 RepID=UPI002E821FED|nr:hypothetical protein [Streptomyces sp. NBC_00557]WUC33149.1 hypothetical protein OG956_02445 [Streptomyces sp. NBC_00557]